jgi:hypothetical protein
LVDRKNIKNKVFNTLTTDGKRIVAIAKEIGVVVIGINKIF